MNSKIAAKLVFGFVLGMFLNGCCTQQVMDSYHKRTVDLFNPSTVYQLTNTSCYAFEGSYSNQPAHTYDLPARFHGYVLIPQTNLLSELSKTNSNLWIDNIQKLAPAFTQKLKTQSKLPSNCRKVIDLPLNKIGLEVNESHPNRGSIAALPFSVIIDIATSPIQIPLYILAGLAMAGGRT